MNWLNVTGDLSESFTAVAYACVRLIDPPIGAGAVRKNGSEDCGAPDGAGEILACCPGLQFSSLSFGVGTSGLWHAATSSPSLYPSASLSGLFGFVPQSDSCAFVSPSLSGSASGSTERLSLPVRPICDVVSEDCSASCCLPKLIMTNTATPAIMLRIRIITMPITAFRDMF